MLYWESQKQYRQAIKYADLYLKYSVCAQERWYVLFARSLCFLALKHQFRAYRAILKAEQELPNRWETKKAKGIILFSCRNYEKALDELVNSFDINKMDCAYKPWKRDDAGTWNLMAECFVCLGQIEKACSAFNQASEKSEDEIQKRFFKNRSDIIMQIANGRKN